MGSRLRISNAAGLVAAALHGFAIVLVTRSLVRQHYESGRLIEVLSHYRVATSTLGKTKAFGIAASRVNYQG